MKYSSIFLGILLIAFSSCKGEKELSDIEQIEANAKKYLFLGDTIDATVSIIDTLHIAELEQMIAKTDENLFFVQKDIDTLSLMIDDLSYQILEEGGNVEMSLNLEEETEVSNKEYQLLLYYYKLEQLKALSLSYSQTNRILYHLKRSNWADITGFEVKVNYEIDNSPIETMVLMDADFNVVD